MKIFTGIVAQFLLRRGGDLVFWLGSLLAVYGALPPSTQATINAVLRGDWQNITIAALIPIVVGVGNFIWSARATILPHATDNGVQVPKKVMTPVQAAKVEEAVEKSRPRTLAERILTKITPKK